MERREINPIDWLSGFNINHGIEVTGVQRVLICRANLERPGRGTAPQGRPRRPVPTAWSNLKAALTEAGMTPTNIVPLNLYTTDVPAFMAQADWVPIFAADGLQPVSTLLGVAALFEPEIIVSSRQPPSHSEPDRELPVPTGRFRPGPGAGRGAAHQQRGDDAVLPGRQVVADLLRRADEGHLLDHLRGDGGDRVLLAAGQVELLDLVGLGLVAQAGERRRSGSWRSGRPCRRRRGRASGRIMSARASTSSSMTIGTRHATSKSSARARGRPVGRIPRPGARGRRRRPWARRTSAASRRRSRRPGRRSSGPSAPR